MRSEIKHLLIINSMIICVFLPNLVAFAMVSHPLENSIRDASYYKVLFTPQSQGDVADLYVIRESKTRKGFMEFNFRSGSTQYLIGSNAWIPFGVSSSKKNAKFFLTDFDGDKLVDLWVVSKVVQGGSKKRAASTKYKLDVLSGKSLFNKVIYSKKLPLDSRCSFEFTGFTPINHGSNHGPFSAWISMYPQLVVIKTKNTKSKKIEVQTLALGKDILPANLQITPISYDPTQKYVFEQITSDPYLAIKNANYRDNGSLSSYSVTLVSPDNKTAKTQTFRKEDLREGIKANEVKPNSSGEPSYPTLVANCIMAIGQMIAAGNELGKGGKVKPTNALVIASEIAGMVISSPACGQLSSKAFNDIVNPRMEDNKIIASGQSSGAPSSQVPAPSNPVSPPTPAPTPSSQGSGGSGGRSNDIGAHGNERTGGGRPDPVRVDPPRRDGPSTAGRPR